MGGIRMVSTAEVFTVKISIDSDESTFRYRRIDGPRMSRIVKKHTIRGNIDWDAVGMEVVVYGLTGPGCGWSGIVASDGKTPIAFDQELIPMLPGDARAQLFEWIAPGRVAPSEAVDEETPTNPSPYTGEPS
jgi:hypothetical protein